MITPVQYVALEAQQLRVFAVEVARTLDAVLADHPAMSRETVTARFALEQIERARTHGLKRRNEMMAWALCARVHGADFEERMPQICQIVAEQNYDRSVLLTLLAMNGLHAAESLA